VTAINSLRSTATDPCEHEAQSNAASEAEHRPEQASQRVVGSVSKLSELLAMLGVKRVLLVLDRDAEAATGSADRLGRALEGLDVATFSDFHPNPTSDQGSAAAMAAHVHGADAIVSFGGGSCNDVAKVAALGARTPELVDRLARGQCPDHADPLPLVSIPTTSGTGSEATHFAAIYVDGRKVSVAHPGVRPRAVVLDPSLHRAMPARLAATCGLDALGQALESLWAVGSTERSRAAAQRAGAMIAEHLVPSVHNGSPSSRAAMMQAANLAGQAINISKTTASHALSYELTQRYGIPHGHAVALTLGHLAATNARVGASDCADPRGPEWVRERVAEASSLLGVGPSEMPGRVSDLLGKLGLARDLKSAGVERHALWDMAGAVDAVRLGNNPRRLTTDGIGAMLADAYGPTFSRAG